MVDSVNRFYASYYLRPRVAWRIVRESLWDSHARTRLFHEAVDFMKLRHERRKVAKKGVQKKVLVSAPPMEPRSNVGVPSESQSA
jgi:hypothetical protein